MKKAFALMKDAWNHFSEDRCARLGAALAYYAIMSMAPLLIVLFGVAGMIFGSEAPQSLMAQIRGFVGPSAAEAIVTMVSSSHEHSGGLGPTIVGGVILLVGATGMFAALQDALNTIWGVGPDPNASWTRMIRQRLLSFVMVFVCLMVLLASLISSAVIQVAGTYFGHILPLPAGTLEAANFFVSLCVITVLFAMMYRVLPDVQIAWSDVWMGAAITSLLFVVGKFALAVYLSRSGVASTYGAAGSLVVLLVWVYYASQIFLFGAEYTQAYANTCGSHLKTADHAVPLTPEQLAEEGIAPREVYERASEEMAERRGRPDAGDDRVAKRGRSDAGDGQVAERRVRPYSSASSERAQSRRQPPSAREQQPAGRLPEDRPRHV